MRVALSIVAVLTVSILTACTAPQTLPTAARSGDTITIALGSQEGMKTDNTTATFTPDATSVPVALTPKAIFNLYPDKRSKAFKAGQDAPMEMVANGAKHEAWLTVMAVDLPANLPAGFGTIKVNTTVAQASSPNAKVENVNYRLEILPGTGAPHNLQTQMQSGYFYGGNLTSLERIPNQAYITPPQTCGATAMSNYGVIQLTFRLPYVIEPYSDVEWFRVIADDLSVVTKNKEPQLIWSARGDELVVSFLSPEGVLKCYEAKFSLVPTDNSFTSLGPPVLLSVEYFDVDGLIATGAPMSQYQVVVR